MYAIFRNQFEFIFAILLRHFIIDQALPLQRINKKEIHYIFANAFDQRKMVRDLFPVTYFKSWFHQESTVGWILWVVLCKKYVFKDTCYTWSSKTAVFYTLRDIFITRPSFKNLSVVFFLQRVHRCKKCADISNYFKECLTKKMVAGSLGLQWSPKWELFFWVVWGLTLIMQKIGFGLLTILWHITHRAAYCNTRGNEKANQEMFMTLRPHQTGGSTK